MHLSTSSDSGSTGNCLRRTVERMRDRNLATPLKSNTFERLPVRLNWLSVSSSRFGSL